MNGAGVRRRGWRWLAIILVAAVLAPYFMVLFYHFGHPVSTLMLWRWSTGQRVERVWTPIGQLPDVLIRTVLASEDARFCNHAGIDLKEIRDALADAEDGAALRGGSTISQQVAKNLFLWHGRSWVRKVFETPLALWLDLVLPKRRILEIYLNVAEWGPNGAFGAEAGARRAFGKAARTVTAREAALMAAILPNPIRRSARQPGPAVRRIAGIVEARARTAGGLDACIRAFR